MHHHAVKHQLETDPAIELKNRMDKWRPYGMDSNNNPCITNNIPAKRWKKDEQGGKICNVGDSVLFNALLGNSGEPLATAAVRDSQDENGHWWRSPLHDYPGDKSSFSKDHWLG